MTSHPTKLVLLMACLCMLGVTAYALRDASTAIPRPPWAGAGAGPTSDMQMLRYVMTVLPLLPEEVFQELEEAVGRDASPGELQSIVYGARMRGDELANHLIDFTNLDTYTNVPDMAWVLRTMQELQSIIAMYGDQWEVFHAGTSGTNAPPTLGEMLYCLILLDELRALASVGFDDSFEFTPYEAIFRLPGGPAAIYRTACRYVWGRNFGTAEYLFRFLVSPSNPNRFTVGNSHYFLAIIDDRNDKPQAALEHIYRVHLYSSCLVHTSHAYIMAAKIHQRLGNWDTARALFSIRVPNYGYYADEAFRSRCSFYNAVRVRDVTNAVRQIVRAERALVKSPNALQHGPSRWKEIVLSVFAGVDYDALHDFMVQKEAYVHYEIDSITRALDGPESAAANGPLMAMLLHDWPSMEEIDQAIMGNRTLCNNVMEQRVRTDITVR